MKLLELSVIANCLLQHRMPASMAYGARVQGVEGMGT